MVEEPQNNYLGFFEQIMYLCYKHILFTDQIYWYFLWLE
jgi:hypothetical protein